MPFIPTGLAVTINSACFSALWQVLFFGYTSLPTDADRVIALKDSWSRGYERRGRALAKLDRLEEAIKSLETAVSLDLENKKLEEELAALKKKASSGTLFACFVAH